jgi:hypothetical protein
MLAVLRSTELDLLIVPLQESLVGTAELFFILLETGHGPTDYIPEEMTGTLDQYRIP